jgi:hypothetical protein
MSCRHGTPDLQPKDVFMQAPEVDWASSHVLGGLYTGDHTPPLRLVPFLPAANKAAFKRSIRDNLTQPILEDWIASVRRIDYLELETCTVVNTSEAIVRAGNQA